MPDEKPNVKVSAGSPRRVRKKRDNPMPYRERVSASISDTRAATGLSPAKIYEKIKSGELKSTTVDGKRLIIVASALALVGAL
jgi:hypothetical protein